MVAADREGGVSMNSGELLPHLGTLQVSFWTVGSVVKHQGPPGRLSGFLQKFSFRTLFSTEVLNSLQTNSYHRTSGPLVC